MKLGLTLSGGGARGIAHLGVLKALDEKNVRPDIISGTSAGALTGSLYAYGYSPEEIFDIVVNTRILTAIKPAWSLQGLVKPESLGDILRKYIKEDDFSALKIPLTVAATEIISGEVEYFSKGELIRPITASCCVPMFFSPVNIGQGIYVDGGLIDNLPAAAIRDKCDRLIGVNVNPINDQFDPKNMKMVVERSLLIAIGENTARSMKLCDVTIEPPQLGVFNGMDLKKAGEIFEIGYECARQILISHSFFS